jgi:hypothetical protein
MDNQQLSAFINETFPGLTFFYRDTNLPDDLIAKYQVGQILKARGFTDMSYKGGGLATNFRYMIASAFGKDLSAFDPTAAQFGLIVLTTDAYFKVLDIYKIGDKTQVLLLNIPERAVDFFKSATINIEEDVTSKARKRFEQLVNAEPVEVLQTPGWTMRTKLPIGMSDTGEMFY